MKTADDLTALVPEFVEFLRSFKNAESLGPDLRTAISVSTNLDAVVAEALEGRRIVLVTGSAGSGKTHLLRSVVGQLPSGVKIVHEPRSVREKHVLVIPDATELSPEERIDLVRKAPATRLGTLIAINEGPLREAASASGGEVYQAATQLLHAAKRGESTAFQADAPTVVDMAAFDPLESRAIEAILALPIVGEAIAAVSSSPHSLRRRCWAQLGSPSARRRVADIVQLARLAQPEWLFRDIWDLVSDLVLGGDDACDPPTSAWFWRLFYGDSALANAIRQVADPVEFAIPSVESRIHFRDWTSTFLELFDGISFVPVSGASNFDQPDWSTWAKAQFLVLGKTCDLAKSVFRGGQGQLLEAVWSGDVSEIVRHVNQYMMYGLGDGSRTRLDLWVDHRVERRIRHHEGLIRLGDAPLSEFRVSASRIVINHPNETDVIGGKERFLFHDATGASLALDRPRLRTLETARSLRVADRTHADLDWDLHSFFARILRTRKSLDELDVYKLDVAAGESKVSKYQISTDPAVIEER